MNSFVIICLAALLSLSQFGCNPDNPEKQRATTQQEVQKNGPAASITENKEIRDIKPVKPSKIKLHRNAKGEYAWDITGDNPDEVARTDSRLRQLLKTDR